MLNTKTTLSDKPATQPLTTGLYNLTPWSNTANCTTFKFPNVILALCHLTSASLSNLSVFTVKCIHSKVTTKEDATKQPYNDSTVPAVYMISMLHPVKNWTTNHSSGVWVNVKPKRSNQQKMCHFRQGVLFFHGHSHFGHIPNTFLRKISESCKKFLQAEYPSRLPINGIKYLTAAEEWLVMAIN